MRLNGLDLNLLVALNALLGERNVSRAAEKVYLSQSAMSGALARLRQFFEDDLLVQVGRRMLLTPRAQALVEPVRDMLIHVESTIAAPPRFDPASARRDFTLLASDYVTAVLIQPLIERLAREAPGIAIHVRSQELGDPVAMMENGDIDLLIIPANYVSADHPSAALYEETYVCVTWKGNRKVRRMDLKEYAAAEHVATHFGGGRMPAFDGWIMERHGISRKLAVVTPWLIYPSRLVVGTDRIATVHKRLAEIDAKHLPIKLWPPPIEIPSLVESMQWHRVRGQDPALAWLRRMVAEVAAVV